MSGQPVTRRGQGPWTIQKCGLLKATAMEFAFNCPGHLGIKTTLSAGRLGVARVGGLEGIIGWGC